MKAIHQFEVYQVELDPTVGSEIAKSRSCVVVSPDDMNAHLNTVIVAPLTRTAKGWPSRVLSHFAGLEGEVALDQLRAVDKRRLTKQLGILSPKVQQAVMTTLNAIFAP
jgi:mRNA interferase MazF